MLGISTSAEGLVGFPALQGAAHNNLQATVKPAGEDLD